MITVQKINDLWLAEIETTGARRRKEEGTKYTRMEQRDDGLLNITEKAQEGYHSSWNYYCRYEKIIWRNTDEEPSTEVTITLFTADELREVAKDILARVRSGSKRMTFILVILWGRSRCSAHCKCSESSVLADLLKRTNQSRSGGISNIRVELLNILRRRSLEKTIRRSCINSGSKSGKQAM